MYNLSNINYYFFKASKQMKLRKVLASRQTTMKSIVSLAKLISLYLIPIFKLRRMAKTRHQMKKAIRICTQMHMKLSLIIISFIS